MMKRLFFLLCIFVPVQLNAQGKQVQAHIDSLLQHPHDKEDTIKAGILIDLTYNYYEISPDNGIQYGKQGLRLAEKLNWKAGIAKVNTYLGANYFVKSDYPNALDSWLKALKIDEELGDKKEVAHNLKMIGRIYLVQNNFNKSLDYYLKALTISESLKDKKNIPDNLGEIGNVYFAQNNLPKALEYYNKALKINIELDDKNGIAENISNIALIYFNQTDYPKTLAYFLNALRMNNDLGDKSSIIQNLGNIGFCYLTIAKDTTGKIKTDSLIPNGKIANLHKAIEYLNKSITLCKETGNLNVLQEHEKDLAEAEELLGNYKDALANYKQFVTAKDSVFNTENNKAMAGLENKHEIELKDKQIEIDRLAVAKKRNERGFYIAGIAAMMVIIFIMLRNFKKQKVTNTLLTTTNSLLSVEKQKSDGLLLNILPGEVADELKETGAAQAKLYDNVTVLFTDFVNFTAAGERMGPQQLVGELHTCFKAFDNIMSKYNIEKIKTVGDAYLAVSGLPVANSGHATDVVAAAIEIRDFMVQRQQQIGEDTFGIRIGIHSGSVVAGIVGVTKFAYDIWGDTVNLAARMEQNSETGKINISETTYNLVKSQFHCTHRGKITAKNKGDIDMYFAEA
jgi:adenylate cyclase